MVPDNIAYMKLQGAGQCMRPIGGRCVGNCRRANVNTECMRPIGGKCVGNCRKSESSEQIEW